MSADSLTTEGRLEVERTARKNGDTLLAAFTGQVVSLGVPSSAGPAYSGHGALIHLMDGETLEKSLWRLDSGKQTRLTVFDFGTSVAVNPSYLNFMAADGFRVTAVGSGVEIYLDALAQYWTAEGISNVTAGEFGFGRFATGITVTKTVIGHILATWEVVTGVTLHGRRAKVGVNP